MVDGLPPGTFVKSISSGQSNLLPGKSRLMPDQSLRVVVGVAAETLEVRVANGSVAGTNARIVLIPEPWLRRRADRYRTGLTDITGAVLLTDIPPGRYIAYAFETLDADAFYALSYDSAAANRLRDRAMPVTVGDPGGARIIELKLIPATETIGVLQ
jgi:hypothetical protein